MQTITNEIDSNIFNIMKSMNLTPNMIINEYLILNISNKISQYSSECKFYENKYNINFTEFEKIVNNKNKKENFEEWDDYLIWTWATQNLEFYKNNLKSLL